MGIIGQMIETDVEIARHQSFVALVWNISHRTPASLKLRAQELDVEAGKPGRPKLEPGQIVADVLEYNHQQYRVCPKLLSTLTVQWLR